MATRSVPLRHCVLRALRGHNRGPKMHRANPVALIGCSVKPGSKRVGALLRRNGNRQRSISGGGAGGFELDHLRVLHGVGHFAGIFVTFIMWKSRSPKKKSE
ncbi:dolichyl-phosphate mannosyltransferase polypeptide 2, regulatory subunit L homeolog isoform X1 [Xenopus laevis]|uniref:Dolichyl-phosphate mannosyltransferase polypeptide 2, regulatory subunit L homeolog isoform X1 n=1 Tax=Xenopus laevis TaxID=8355 RepID=A0A8J1LH79_XENLA|nr:dolichyl-phosphate mannosyltransferase polypeptide 2, regulatory subunit L homeolog isoform X1 [Xenopus laevis]